jgi:anti-sigma regulatory factor
MERIVLASTETASNELLEFLDRLFMNVDGLADLEANVQVAICETFNNAVVHGNKLDFRKRVTCTFDITDTAFVFTIEDEGEGFEIEKIPDPTLPENIEKTRGRGVFLTQKLSSKVEYLDKGRRVIISFYKKK